MHAPCHLHFMAIRRIISYLLGISPNGLFFTSGSRNDLNIFCDCDWMDVQILIAMSRVGACFFDIP